MKTRETTTGDISRLQHWGDIDAQPVHRAIISDGAGSQAAIIGLGGVLQRLQINGQDVVLGLNSLDDYRAHSPFFGANAGRVVNRIPLGELHLPDGIIQLPTNEGAHHLHGGGAVGIGKRVWTFDAVSDDSVKLSITTTQADDGYPGDAVISLSYAFTSPGVLQLTFSATVTELGPINLAHHSYFNLTGAPTILDHHIQIHADRYHVTDAAAIPLWTDSVDNSAYDFRTAKTPVWHDIPLAVDNNFCVGGSDLREIAVVTDPDSERTLRVISDQPDVQFYCGHKVNVSVPGLEGRTYGPFAGLCLEPQIRPNALRDGWEPTGLVQPGEKYKQVLQLVFEGFEK